MNKFLQIVEALKSNDSTGISLFALKYNASKIVSINIDFNDGLRSFFKASLDYLINEEYLHKEIKEYPKGDLKNNIEALPIDSDLIRARYDIILRALQSPETNNKNIEDYKAYVICANLNKHQAYFITLARPFKTLDNSSYWFFERGSYKQLNSKLLNLIYHFDCIIINNYCYLITLKAESFLQLPKEYAAKREECLHEIVSTLLIKEEVESEIRKYLNKHYNRALIYYDNKIIEELGAVNAKNKAGLIKQYEVDFSISEEGKIILDLSTPEKVKSFIEIITKKRGRDLREGKLVCSNSPLMPVE